MLEAYKRFWKNYANFNGRSTRADYWYVYLVTLLLGFAFYFLIIVSSMISEIAFIFALLLYLIYGLAQMIPSYALLVRRLHDINKSGWSLLMMLIPIAGPIILFVFMCTASVDENNRYGSRV